MSGTKAGAAKAMATIRETYGPDFHAKIGAKGGQRGHTGGWYGKRHLARAWGAVGGSRGKRGPAKKKEQDV